MKSELQRRLIEKYPKLYAGCHKPPSESLMAFGFQCDDGWFDLIDTLSENLMIIVAEHGERDANFSGNFTVMHVKEKYGTLSFYAGPRIDKANAVIDFAESMSAKICETCGNRGRLRGALWFKALCDSCAEQQGYEDVDPSALP
jgi:hypothetical protein